MKKKIISLCLVIALGATAVIGGTLAYFTDTDTVDNTFTMGKVDILLDEAPVDENGKEIEGARVEGNDYTPTNMVPGYVFDKDPTIHVLKGSEDSYIFLDVTFNKFSSLFWVMAADAAEDDAINLPLYTAEGALADTFKNDKGVFSTTKFVEYMKANQAISELIINKWFNDIEHLDWAKRDVIIDGNYLTLRLAYQGDTDNTPNTVNAKEIDDESIDIEFMTGFQMPASVTQEMIAAGQTVGGMENAFNTEKANFNLSFTAYAIQAATLDTVDDAYAAMFN